MELKPIKMTLQEAQFTELRKYTALQIAAAFGIKPNHLNNYEKSSYANSEMQQLSFLVDTMLYRLAIYEQEINSKILTFSEEKEGYFYKFNEKALLRADAKTQMETIAEGVQNALYTPNEGREYLDLPAKEGGDILICNGNYMPVEMAGAQYAGKEESNGGDQH
jgi:HK97 family phage portal protein